MTVALIHKQNITLNPTFMPLYCELLLNGNNSTIFFVNSIDKTYIMSVFLTLNRIILILLNLSVAVKKLVNTF